MNDDTFQENVSRIPISLKINTFGEAKGELIRFLAPRTVDSLVRALPLEGRLAIGKGQVYFQISSRMGEEKAKRKVEKGTLAYWPMGRAFCIFFEEIQPYSRVNLIGRITSNLELFSEIKSGLRIFVNKI